jgi:hypothetical protein
LCARFHIVHHLRSCYHIVNGEGRVLHKLRVNEAIVRELSVGSFPLPLLIGPSLTRCTTSNSLALSEIP